jgi:hypothetical protein
LANHVKKQRADFAFASAVSTALDLSADVNLLLRLVRYFSNYGRAKTKFKSA